MSDFVLDNSVSMRWLFPSDKTADQRYAVSVLESISSATALVPDLWHLEAANVLVTAIAQGDIEPGNAERFTSQLRDLPIQVDAHTATHTFGTTLALAKAYRLSSYDAAYLELALRQDLPLATLDKALIKAARKSSIEVFSP